MHYSLKNIPSGESGTDITVHEMISLTKESLKNPIIRLHLLKNVLCGVPFPRTSGNVAVIVRSAYNWVRRNIRFIDDPVGVETVQSPEITLKVRAGDCDDHSILLASLFLAAGIPSRFVVVGSRNSSFSHVYVETLVDGNWIAVDTSAPKLGISPPPLGAKKIYKIIDDRGLTMNSQVLNVNRDQLSTQIYNYVYDYLSRGWDMGQIDYDDLKNYSDSIQQGTQPFSNSALLADSVLSAVKRFSDYVILNGIPARKKTFSGGLSGLSGFFGSLWTGIKTVVKPVIVGGATIINPAAGAAAATILYGGGKAPADVGTPGFVPASGTRPTVSIPVGGGTVTYESKPTGTVIRTGGVAVAPARVIPGTKIKYGTSFATSDILGSVSGFLSSPVGMIAAAGLLFLLLRKK